MMHDSQLPDYRIGTACALIRCAKWRMVSAGERVQFSRRAKTAIFLQPLPHLVTGISFPRTRAGNEGRRLPRTDPKAEHLGSWNRAVIASAVYTDLHVREKYLIALVNCSSAVHISARRATVDSIEFYYMYRVGRSRKCENPRRFRTHMHVIR